MIAAIAGRFSAEGLREVDRYAGWSAATRQLQDDWANAHRPGVQQLRSYLQNVPAEHQSGALFDLIAAHLRLRWQAGYGTRMENYVTAFGAEFSELTSTATVPADLVEDEFLARHLLPHGDMPALEEYEQRFPNRGDVLQLLRQRCLDGGRYIKLHKRGQGAMGEVYEAYDRHLRRLVAIKEPKRRVAETDGVLHRFADEARVTAGLEHPGIVSVHEFHPGREKGVRNLFSEQAEACCTEKVPDTFFADEDNCSPFYVMRLVDGRSLGECIRECYQRPTDRTAAEQRLLWTRLLQSFVTVCDAMAYAHARGVLHRDLKPGNIVVGEFGETVILDWGMGKRVGLNPLSSAQPGDDVVGIQARSASEDNSSLACASGLCPASARGPLVVGTPQYMPPEQVDGLADARSDVFGLGAVLYEILTGRSPHAWPEGARPADWMRRVREAQFPAPRRVKSQTPRALEAICLKALARNPTDRYPKAAALALEVRRYLAGQPVDAYDEPKLERAWRWLFRRQS